MPKRYVEQADGSISAESSAITAKYEDTKAGAIQCLKETTEEDLVEFILRRTDEGEFHLTQDAEHPSVWAVRGDYQTLAVIYLLAADVEVSERLYELMQ
jgi:hypothetical protein